MRQFVAPTRRMMPISLRRSNTAMRTVFPINAAEEIITISARASPPILKMFVTFRSRS